jgi:hypothetical protein
MSSDADKNFHAKIGPMPADPGPSKLERLVREWRIAADAWDHELLMSTARAKAYVDAEQALRIYARAHL